MAHSVRANPLSGSLVVTPSDGPRDHVRRAWVVNPAMLAGARTNRVHVCENAVRDERHS